MRKSNLPVRRSPMEEQMKFIKELVPYSVLELPQKIDRRWIKLIFLLILGIVLLNKEVDFAISLGNNSPDPNKNKFGLLTANSQGLFLDTDNFFDKSKDQATRKKEQCQQYIERFSKVAVAEMELYNIPASITMAQAILESNIGNSKLATRNNNHFGLKCFSRTCVKGHCSNFEDDHHKDFFRAFDSAWASYREHSKFLSRKRYKHLQKLDTKDYKNWAEGLQAAGYATDKRYAKKIIRLIQALKLYELDVYSSPSTST